MTDVPEDLKGLAWAGFLGWALDNEDLRAAFVKATGRRFDDADGIMAFTVWATRTHYGWDEAPACFRRDAEAWEKKSPGRPLPN